MNGFKECVNKLFIDILCGFALIKLIDKNISVYGFKLSNMTKSIISLMSITLSGMIFGIIIAYINKMWNLFKKLWKIFHNVLKYILGE